ncbi:MAG: hypothetical protein V7L27_15680 [Nostoc sp.]|uniref:hypothetical protein n=1 Tax=Nostoc sp. TaxID=1180 RepID=UPI002FF786C4
MNIQILAVIGSPGSILKGNISGGAMRFCELTPKVVRSPIINAEYTGLAHLKAY